MIVGYLLALFGAAGSGLGSVLESLGVRRAGAYGGNSNDLGRVARQWVYWAGVFLDLFSFVCVAAALYRLPLFLVQSVMAFSVGITALISHVMGILMPKRGWYALVAGALGLVLLAVSAQPGPAQPLPAGWRWMLLGMVVPIGVIAWFGNRVRDRWAAPLLAFGAGLGFAVVAVSARSLPPFDSFASFLTDQGVWAIAVNGVAATVVFAMALQNGSATTASAITFTTDTAVPSLIGLLVLGDTVRPGLGWVAVLGFLLAVGGAIAIAHYAEVATVEHDQDLAPASPPRPASQPPPWANAPPSARTDPTGR